MAQAWAVAASCEATCSHVLSSKSFGCAGEANCDAEAPHLLLEGHEKGSRGLTWGEQCEKPQCLAKKQGFEVESSVDTVGCG